MTTTKQSLRLGRMTVHISISVLIVLLILATFSVYLWWKWRIPKCGGYIDPTIRWCDDNGKLVTGKPIPEAQCDPSSTTQSLHAMTRFFGYVTRLSRHSQQQGSLSSSLSSLGKTRQGFLLFAVPDLLQILPSDFGQNYTTPYGMISFYDAFIPCIDNPAKFCDYISKNQGETIQNICTAYFQHKKEEMGECPFSVTDHSPDASVNDPNFFNALGLLGTFSLQANQAVVFFTDLPVADLGLNYWSYVLYMADSLDPNSQCSPKQQIVFASLSAPLNMFTAVGVSGKKFNPLTAETGTVVKGHVRFFTIVAPDPQLAKSIQTRLQTSPPYAVDFVHILEVPSGAGSTKLDPLLENPNQLSTQDAAYHPGYQRLSCFLRLSPSPSTSTPTTSQNIQDFIFAKGAYTHHSEVVLLETTPSANTSLYTSYPLPVMIPPAFNEVSQLSKAFHKTKKAFVHRLQWTGYSVHSLPTRNSTLNIFAPLFRNVLRTKDPYLGGFQAIQLAGNGQGDNPDAQYRLSGSACLTNHDVLVAYCVNHAFFGNAVYNSVNVLDTNRAYGYGATVLDSSFQKPYYIVLMGRSLDTLNQTEARIRQGLSGLSDVSGNVHDSTTDVDITKIPIRTGPSQEGNVPLCHQLLMVERTYLNPTFSSISSTGGTHRLTDLFGPHLDTLEETVPESAWQSLVNVTAPTNETLIPPAYFKVSYSPMTVQRLLLVTVFILVLLLLVWVTFIVYLGRH